MGLLGKARATGSRPVLIIDDDPNAIVLAKRALQNAGITNPTVCFSDGRTAIAHLQRCINDEEVMPMFVFLDLKMPGIDGFHVLDWLRRQPALRRLVTVVLSMSAATEDVSKAFELGADAYVYKFPPVSEIKTLFQLANAMLSVEELEKALWPGIKRPAEIPAETVAESPVEES